MNKFINLALFALIAGLNNQANSANNQLPTIDTSSFPTCTNRNAASCLNSYAFMLFSDPGDVSSWLQSDQSNQADLNKTRSIIQNIQQYANTLNIQQLQQQVSLISEQINGIEQTIKQDEGNLNPIQMQKIQSLQTNAQQLQTILQRDIQEVQNLQKAINSSDNPIKSFNLYLVSTLNSWCDPTSNQWLSKSPNCNTFNNHIKPNFLPNN